MIYDKVENALFYYGIHPNFEKAMRFISTQDYHHMPVGRHETHDPDLIFDILEYSATPESANKVVAHRKNGEIWIMLTANEQIKFAPACECVEKEAYLEETDRVTLMASTHTVFPMVRDSFVVLLPTDAHSHEPIDKNDIVKKVILWFRLMEKAS